MTKKMDKLTIVPVNKTVVFYSPIEGDDTMVRTGTTGDGSCMFHSVLHAHSKEYTGMDKHDRSKMVRQLRASMAGNVDEESWQELGGGLIAKIPFQEILLRQLTAFYRFVNTGQKPRSRDTQKLIDILERENIETYKIFTEFIDLDDLEKTILPEAYNQSEDGIVDNCCTSVIAKCLKHTNKRCSELHLAGEQKKKVCKLVTNTMNIITDYSRKTSFKKYVAGLKAVGEDVDSFTIGLISDRFDRDIYFLDGDTRLPYRDASHENLQGRKSIIIIWIGGIHYEIVGRLLHGNRIQREFEPGDHLIQKLRTLLTNPQDVAEKYPDLVPYIPREFRDFSSDEEEEEEEEEESDEEDSDRSGRHYAGSDSSYHSTSSDSDM
jgi:hypothetical protein